MHYGQFLLEESRLLEAAEMAKTAARLDGGEFDVVFSAAHMLRQAKLNEAAEKYYGQAASLRPNVSKTFTRYSSSLLFTLMDALQLQSNWLSNIIAGCSDFNNGIRCQCRSK
ncbi:hypothetical protein XENORESO_003819 [Xenotaenia resolanae]|uniref:Uncharacterized protein n=1 Tax=Xenotaenia resolanae TaxID=208358 RepID=A0ABV0X839_9TELE